MTSPPELTGVHFTPSDRTSSRNGKPLLVLGPSLGTSASALWGACAALLTDRFHVVGWDLPGHGGSPAARQAFDVSAVASAVLALVDRVLRERGEPGGSFLYAGDSVGGAIGLQLLLDHPGRVRAAAVICSGAAIGTAEEWLERADIVRSAGTPAMVQGSAARWFAAGFVERRLSVASTLLQSLQDTERFSYAWACDALAAFDVRDRLGEISAPVLAVAGAQDVITPPESAREIAAGVLDGRFAVLDAVAHLAPAEDPNSVARLLADFADAIQSAKIESAAGTPREVHDEGMRVRREVLGDAHVDRAAAAVTGFTAEFQEFITGYAWGSIWTRPGLDRRSRSIITLTALVAQGHHEELALHVRAARTNGLSNDEIKEVLLQCAVYCGVPAANTAFRIAQEVLSRLDVEGR